MTTQPSSIVCNSELTQDFITSDGVLVDGSKTGQVAVFRNPNKGGAVEALVISNALGAAHQLFYLSSDPTSRTGWNLIALTDSGGNALFATEVLAFATTWGSVDAFYIGSGGHLTHLWMDASQATGWIAPQGVDGAPVGLSQLRVAFSPGATTSSGTLIVYAIDPSGNVLLNYADNNGNWSAQTTWIGGSASSWTLAMRDTTSWLLSMVLSGSFVFAETFTMRLVFVQNGWSAWMWGTIGLGSLVVEGANTDEGVQSSVLSNATNMAGTSATMMLFLGGATDGDGGHPVAWIINPGASDQAAGTVAGTSFIDAAIVEGSDGLVDIYGIDPELNLLTLRQIGFNAAQMTAGFGDTQTWGPLLQLDTRIRRIAANPTPSDAPALIAVDADVGALHLFSQDPATALWLTTPIRLPTATQVELDRWRTEITVYDADGQPLANTALTVNAASVVDLEVNGQFFVVDSDHGAAITTNALGKATLSSLATSLAPPALTFAAAGLPTQAPHSPAGAVNDYLAGTGALFGKPTFDATAVGQLATNSGVDASVALTAIQQAAQLGQQAAGNAAAQAKIAAQLAAGEGVHVYDRAGGRTTHRAFATRAEADAHVAATLSISSVWDDVWDAAKKFAGDVWDGIKQGIQTVECVVVDFEHQAIRIFLQIGDALVQLADWIVDTVEDALQAITAVFNWIGAEVDKVIDFLKALFDFQAIWNTKTVLAAQLTALPGNLADLLGTWSNTIQSDFFTARKATIDKLFTDAIAHFDGTPFTSLTGWSPMGQPPSASASIAGGATQSDLANNPHANWLQDRVSSYAPTSIATPTGSNTALSNFLAALIDAGTDLVDAFSAFGKGVANALQSDSLTSFEDIAISTFLTMAKDLVDALIDLADAAVQGLLTLAAAAMDGLGTLLSTPLQLGFVNDVYAYVAQQAGGSPTMTIADLVALLAAFPITIVYKLIAGVDQEPFPNGQPPQDALQAPARLDTAPLAVSDTVKQVFGTVAGVLTVISGGLSVASDATSPDTPSWITIASIGVTGLHVAFTHPGFLDWSPLEWGTAAAVAANLLWLGPTGYFLYTAGLQSAADAAEQDVAGKLASEQPTWSFDDLTNIGDSLLGVAELGFATYSLIEAPDSPPMATTANFIEPLPTLFSFLTITPLKDTPVGPFALGFKIALDLIAGIAGGGLEIASAWKE